MLIPRLLITFRSTTDALRAEEVLQTAGVPGRLIPLPAAVRADCGMGFMCAPEDREKAEHVLESAGISPAGFYDHQTRS